MDFSTGSQVPVDDGAPAASGSKTVHAPRFNVTTDAKRDELLTEFGKDTLRDRYLLPGESYQDLFARVAAAYSDDSEPEFRGLGLRLDSGI
jgi:ribonucleoside-diphosphate reductase alpha chain